MVRAVRCTLTNNLHLKTNYENLVAFQQKQARSQDAVVALVEALTLAHRD
jgi:hypothetical protein